MSKNNEKLSIIFFVCLLSVCSNPVNNDFNPISQDAGTVTDIDANVYHAIKIGNQVWTVENLRTTKYNDGTSIPLVTTDATWGALSTPGFCYFNNTTNVDSIKKFGALYNWYVANPTNPRLIAPVGWHVPTNAEWDTLQNFLIANGYSNDASNTAFNIAKSLAAKTDWNTDTTHGAIGNDLSKNNRSGFSAIPCGYRFKDSFFYGIGSRCYWWGTTESQFNTSLAYFHNLSYDFDDIGFGNDVKSIGVSLRLVRD